MMDKPLIIEDESSRIRPPGSEVERLVANNQLAHELLGWEPRIKLEEGLKLTIAWIGENIEDYRPGLYAV